MLHILIYDRRVGIRCWLLASDGTAGILLDTESYMDGCHDRTSKLSIKHDCNEYSNFSFLSPYFVAKMYIKLAHDSYYPFASSEHGALLSWRPLSENRRATACAPFPLLTFHYFLYSWCDFVHFPARAAFLRCETLGMCQFTKTRQSQWYFVPVTDSGHQQKPPPTE